DGVTASSASYRITLESVGEGLVGTGLSSASYRMDGSFAGAYPPPGEVRGLRFASRTELRWDPERSVGTYDVYRDAVSSLPGGQYGVCWQSGLADEKATDVEAPPPGTGRFYLVTARNRLQEEGPKGDRSDGSERGGSACP
ncbi:MAG: hypothetical protein D6718_12385, partial [Acidobacteria bacterium]